MIIQLIMQLFITNQLHYILFLIYFVLGKKHTQLMARRKGIYLVAGRARHMIPFAVWTW